jgi:hypothetical protein
MKTRISALLLIAVLPLLGFDCIVSPFTVSINLDPFNGPYAIDPGPLTYNKFVNINPGSLYDTNYKLTGASVYDIKVSTSGPDDLGACAGVILVNNDTLMTFSGTWRDFTTPQSLLTSPLIKPRPAGVTTLVNAVVSNQRVELRAIGRIATPAKAANTDFVTVAAYVQAYGQID